MNSFLGSLNYSSSNEDARSECRALCIGPSDSILCVTGSGARALDLLTRGPWRIVSVDFNPRQNDLLHLKLAALRCLSHEDFLALLGVSPSSRRLELYQAIKGDLPESTRRYWDGCASAIARGVIYEGRWERYFARLSRIVRLVRADRLCRLFASGTVDEQAALWRAEWADGWWRSFLRVASGRVVWKYVLRDPGFYEYVEPGFDGSAYLSECFDRAADSILFRESAVAWLLFFGKYDPNGPLPLYLQEECYERLRLCVDRVDVKTSSAGSLLATTNERFSAFSLSDLASYTSPREYEALWTGIRRTALPGARFCERQFLVKRKRPAWISRRDTSMETELRASDRSIFYTFGVGIVRAKASLPSQATGRR